MLGNGVLGACLEAHEAFPVCIVNVKIHMCTISLAPKLCHATQCISVLFRSVEVLFNHSIVLNPPILRDLLNRGKDSDEGSKCTYLVRFTAARSARAATCDS